MGKKWRAAILASGSGSNFEAIVNATRRGEVPIEITKLVYNKEEANVKKRAARLDIHALYISHLNFPTREAFDLKLVSELKKDNVELVILAGWMRLFSASFLDHFPNTLNIHPSLLPHFRGLHAIERAYSAGVLQTGCTVHRVVVDMDSGPLVAQSFVRAEGLSLGSLRAKIQEAEHSLYPKAISFFIRNQEK